MSIETIPLELMRLIGADLIRTNMVNLQRSCKSLRALLEPLLYETIDWEFPPLEDRRSPKPPLHLLLRSMLDHPELGTHLRSFTIRERGMIQVLWQDPQKSELTSSDLERLASRGAFITNPKPEHWLEELERGNHEAFLTLLLSQCPNLEMLVLDNDFSRAWAWNSTDQEPNYETLWKVVLKLRRLRVFDCDRNGKMQIPWYADRISSLLTIPCISSLKISLQQSEVIVDKPLRGINALFLTTLELHRSLLTEETIRDLVAAAPNLTSLLLDIERHTRIEESAENVSPWLDCSVLAQALTPIKSCLKNLTISTTWGAYGNSAYDNGQGGHYDEEDRATHGLKGEFGGFKDFTSLQRLEIVPEILFGWWPGDALSLRELIPDSLTELYLRCEYLEWKDHGLWDTNDLKEVFTEYGSGGSGGKLKRITFLFFEDEDPQDHSPVDHTVGLDLICIEAGLSPRILRGPRPAQLELWYLQETPRPPYYNDQPTPSDLRYGWIVDDRWSGPDPWYDDPIEIEFAPR